MAEELIIPRAELDSLSNFFLDCVYSQQKTLRQTLIRMNFKNEEGGTSHPKLLDTYMNIVKTGSPEEINRFSKIERQKLVELLCTNQDLLNFMFDKMFFNNQKEGPGGSGEISNEETDAESTDHNKKSSAGI